MRRQGRALGAGSLGRLPGGLRPRLILTLLAALLVVQGATLALFLDERRRAIRVNVAEAATARALVLAAEIEPLAPAARRAAIGRTRTRFIRFHLADAPAVDADAARRFAGVTEHIAAELGGLSRPIRLAVGDRDGPSGSGHHRRPALHVAVGLDDGGWLNARVRVRRPPLQWAWPALTSFALAGLAIALIVWVSVGRILRPMDALAAAVERLGRGERPEALALAGPTETRRLADAFNRMAERLTRLLDERARTLAAIGHDLRSPITAMRLRVEMVDEAETRERLAACLDEIETLTEAALALSRGSGAEEARAPVDLAELLAGLVAEALERGERASLEIASPVAIEGRPLALRRSLRNLAENALRYGGAARITLGREGDAARITIDDDGPGIAEADRARVFEPFVRLEGSRSRDTGGAGLGLAIARAAIEAHDGGIAIEDAPGGGARVVVRLPLG
ncbi:MAG: ATP-binding protein [Paracoccaceae bacterium]